jgi:hypothetical protein
MTPYPGIAPDVEARLLYQIRSSRGSQSFSMAA